MKTLVFGLQLDNKVSPIGMGGDNIDFILGPQSFTIWLEKRMRLKYPEENQSKLRIEIYRQQLGLFIQNHPDAFFAKSFAADPFATANTLLSLRDDLLLSGWKGNLIEKAPKRLSDIFILEAFLKNNTFWPKGWADRQALLLELISQKCNFNLSIHLVEPLELLPYYWQVIFSILEKNGSKIHNIPSEPSADSNTDLGVFQRFLESPPSGDSKKFKAKGDGSLCLFKGKRDTELASWLAKWIYKNDNWFPILLLPDKTRTLDNALISEGLPSLGLQTRSDSRPSLQLLKLVPEFLWNPVDPSRILAFLTLPLQPIPYALSKKLASILANRPGFFGPEWQNALEKIKEISSEEEWIGIKEEYDFWFNRTRYAQKDWVPKEDIIGLFNHIYEWSQLKIPDHESRLAIEGQILNLLDLLNHVPESKLSYLDVVRLMRTALDPIGRSPVQAQKNHIQVTHHSAAILEPVKDLIWWTFTQKETDYFFSKWYEDELRFLHQFNIFPDLPTKENQRISWYRKQAFLKTTGNLFLFLPNRVEGSEIQPFPLFGDLNACFENMGEIEIQLDIHQWHENSSLSLLSNFKLPELTTISTNIKDENPMFINLNQINKLPERLEESYTSLESLFYFPYKWVFQYKLGLYKADNLEMVGEKRLYGNLAHRLFEKLFSNATIWKSIDSEIENWLEANISSIFEQEGSILLLYGKEPERISLTKKLIYSIVNFIKIMKNSGWEPDSAEKELRGLFCSTPVTGFVDLILKRGNERAIIDLKWSGKKTRVDLIKNNEDLQLALYHSLLNQNGSFDQVYTAFYIIESADIISRNEEAFSITNKKLEPANPKVIYEQILQKMSNTYLWRKEQLAEGKIEIRTEANIKSLDALYGGNFNLLLEMKKENSRFDNFKSIVNLPN